MSIPNALFFLSKSASELDFRRKSKFCRVKIGNRARQGLEIISRGRNSRETFSLLAKYVCLSRKSCYFRFIILPCESAQLAERDQLADWCFQQCITPSMQKTGKIGKGPLRNEVLYSCGIFFLFVTRFK